MQDYTVIIKDVADSMFVYHLHAPNAAQAGMHAMSVWSAHANIGGAIEFVIIGKPEFAQATSGRAAPEVISLDPPWYGEAA